MNKKGWFGYLIIIVGVIIIIVLFLTHFQEVNNKDNKCKEQGYDGVYVKNLLEYSDADCYKVISFSKVTGTNIKEYGKLQE